MDDLNASFTDLEVRALLGHGGMGAVYEAWQKSLHRPVALKILPADLLGSEDFFDRFQREARAMAQMDHPHVAKVFETGITDAGEPYIVMELIRGEPVTAFATRQSLALRERLDLFLKITSGVQHAHQKGMLHRDLQPSNILVTVAEGQAVPKVIDFGLAKPLGDSPPDEAIWRSAGAAAGTPAYMSPEHLNPALGGLDTRSDVYSLGVLLYELLTGGLPYEEAIDNKVTRTTLNRVLSESPLPWPSKYAAAQKAGKRRTGNGTADVKARPALCPAVPAASLQGELDAIVLKAAAKAPAHRYQTVAGLADDIEHYLTHQPVTAVQPTIAYLLGKFVRRHRLGLTMAASAFALTVLGMALLARESMLTRVAERRADAQLQKGERLIDFMLGELHDKLDRVGRLDALESTVAEVEKFYAEPGVAAAPPESLRHRAHARFILGRIRNSQGQRDAAKANYLDSIRLYDLAISLQSTNLNWQDDRVRVWNSLAVVHHLGRDLRAAESAYQEALRLNERMLAIEPAGHAWIDRRASLLHNLASLYDHSHRLDEAEKNYQEALRLWEPLRERMPESSDLAEHLALCQQNLAFVHGKRGQVERAHQSNLAALRLVESLVERDPRDTRWIARLADIQQNISEFLHQHNRLDEASEWLDKYLPLREKLARLDPANAYWQHHLADAYRTRARLAAERGDDDTAALDLRQAWGISEKLLPNTNSDASWRPHWLEGLKLADGVFLRLAQRDRQSGSLQTARDHWQTLVELREKRLGENLNDFDLRRQVVEASLELASLDLALGAKAKSVLRFQLALLHIRHCLAGGQPLTLTAEPEGLLGNWRRLTARPTQRSPRGVNIFKPGLRRRLTLLEWFHRSMTVHSICPQLWPRKFGRPRRNRRSSADSFARPGVTLAQKGPSTGGKAFLGLRLPKT